MMPSIHVAFERFMLLEVQKAEDNRTALEKLLPSAVIAAWGNGAISGSDAPDFAAPDFGEPNCAVRPTRQEIRIPIGS